MNTVDYRSQTLKGYDAQAQEFADRSLNIDMGKDYTRFLQHLPEKAHILDAGCGAGRDVKAFKERGFEVTGFDGSAELVLKASEVSGQAIQQLRFEEVEFESEFDGIWASASLLHLKQEDLLPAMQRLWTALKPNGHWFMSFKVGEGLSEKGGRHYVYQTEDSLRGLISNLAQSKILDLWVTDSHSGRDLDRKWIQVIVHKEKGAE